MKKKILVLLGVLLLGSCSLQKENTENIVSNFQKSSLGQNEWQTMSEEEGGFIEFDQNGVLYVVQANTPGGVAPFFKKYENNIWHNIPLPSDTKGIINMKLDPNGILYIISYGQGDDYQSYYRVYKYINETWENISPPISTEDRMEYMDVSPNGVLYIILGGQILKYDNNSWQYVANSALNVRNIKISPSGEVYTLSAPSKVYKYVDGVEQLVLEELGSGLDNFSIDLNGVLYGYGHARSESYGLGGIKIFNGSTVQDMVLMDEEAANYYRTIRYINFNSDNIPYVMSDYSPMQPAHSPSMMRVHKYVNGVWQQVGDTIGRYYENSMAGFGYDNSIKFDNDDNLYISYSIVENWAYTLKKYEYSTTPDPVTEFLTRVGGKEMLTISTAGTSRGIFSANGEVLILADGVRARRQSSVYQQGSTAIIRSIYQRPSGKKRNIEIIHNNDNTGSYRRGNNPTINVTFN